MPGSPGPYSRVGRQLAVWARADQEYDEVPIDLGCMRRSATFANGAGARLCQRLA